MSSVKPVSPESMILPTLNVFLAQTSSQQAPHQWHINSYSSDHPHPPPPLHQHHHQQHQLAGLYSLFPAPLKLRPYGAIQHTHTHTHPFNGPVSSTTRVKQRNTAHCSRSAMSIASSTCCGTLRNTAYDSRFNVGVAAKTTQQHAARRHAPPAVYPPLLIFSLRIDPLHFQTGCRKRRLNVDLFFLC